MTRRNSNTTPDYSAQFKPAVQLGRPTLDQWSESFFATKMQEQYDDSGEHFLRLGRGVSNAPGLSAVTQLTTPLPSFVPNFREVEVLGKKNYTALCVDGGANQLGVCVYLLQTVDTGGGNAETHINLRYMPFAMLTDLVVATTTAGLLEINLPTTDIAKLNVTLRASPAGEPEFRTFKTEVVFENLPLATQQQIETQLNFQSASIAAFNAFQILSSEGQWPPAVKRATAGNLQVPPWASMVKKVIVATLVTIGSVVGVVGAATENHVVSVVGLGIGGAGIITNYWLNLGIPDFPPARPAQVVPQAEPV